MIRTWNKLVRDRIPQIIEADGLKPITRVLDTEEFASALRSKLLEEADELINARTTQGIIAEVADVLEVLFAICDAHTIDWDDVSQLRDSKRRDRGGFSERIFLIETRAT